MAPFKRKFLIRAQCWGLDSTLKRPESQISVGGPGVEK